MNTNNRVELEFCEFPEICETCGRALRIFHNLKIERYVRENPNLPHVSRLTIVINPTEDNILLQNYESVEYIIGAIFKEIDCKHDEEMKTWSLVLLTNVHLAQHYTYPVLKLSIYFFGKMSKAIDEKLDEISSNLIPKLTGHYGEYEHLSDLTQDDLISEMTIRNSNTKEIFGSMCDDVHNPYGTKNLRDELKSFQLLPFHPFSLEEIRDKNFAIKSFREDSCDYLFP